MKQCNNNNNNLSFSFPANFRVLKTHQWLFLLSSFYVLVHVLLVITSIVANNVITTTLIVVVSMKKGNNSEERVVKIFNDNRGLRVREGLHLWQTGNCLVLHHIFVLLPRINTKIVISIFLTLLFLIL